MKLRAFWQNKVSRPVIALLKQGIEPRKIALGIACGIALGIVPMFGSTTLLCALAALALRLNPAAIQLVNYLVYPLQIALLIPFYRAGEFLFDAEPLPLSAIKVVNMIRADVWGAIDLLWDTTWHALVVWLLLAPPLIGALYYSLLPAIRKLLFKASRRF